MNFSVLTLLLYFVGAIMVCFICLVLSFMLYLHYIHKINAHLPGPPRPSFIFGNLAGFWKYKEETSRTISEYVMENQLKYGPVLLLTYFNRCVVYLGDPNYIREVFVNNDKLLYKPQFLYNKMGFVYGERGIGYGLVTNLDEVSWRKRRHLMNPAFHRKCLKDFMSNYNDVSSRFLTHMGKIADVGKPVGMVQEFGKATLDVISKVSFNIDTNTIEDPESPFPSAIRNYLFGSQANFESPLSSQLLGIFQYKIIQSKTQKVQIDAARFLRNFALDCITTRKKDMAENKDVPNDLLSLLINDGSLTKEEIIDEFITIFIAGQETTASTMGYIVYEVLSNPHVETKLLNEIKEVLGEREHVEFGDLAKLKYLGQVFEESLRLHPIGLVPIRTLKEEITIGGYRIPKGDGVASGPLSLALNPKIWKDPEVFDPERFADAGNIPNLSMIHFPFSVGPRNCIGQTFAKFEAKVVLARLFQKFRFKLLPGQTGRMMGRMTLTPRDGVMCAVRRHTK